MFLLVNLVKLKMVYTICFPDVLVEEYKTCRGTVMLLAYGYRFSRENVRGHKTRWQCTQKSRTRCRAYITTIDGQVIRHNFEHNHGSIATQKQTVRTQRVQIFYIKILFLRTLQQRYSSQDLYVEFFALEIYLLIIVSYCRLRLILYLRGKLGPISQTFLL